MTAGQLSRPARPLRLEVMGVAASGKTTLTARLRAAGWTPADSLHLRKAAHACYALRGLPGVLPLLRRGTSRDDLRYLMYVSTWDEYLRRQPPGSAPEILDQGPLFALARFAAEQRPVVRSARYQDWWRRTVERWACELDVVVLLDAPDEILWERIQSRDQSHQIKGVPLEDGMQFLARYRAALGAVLTLATAGGGLRVLHVDTSTVSREDVAEAVLAQTTDETAEQAARGLVPDQRRPDGTAERQRARLRLLHVILVLGETNSQYNEHCLPTMHERDLTICTYFTPKLRPPDDIRVVPGDDSIRGFFRALRTALDAGPYDALHAHAPQTGVLLPLAMAMHPRFWRSWATTVYTVHDSFYDYKPRNQLLMLVPLTTFRRVVFCSQAAYDSLPPALRRLVGRRARVVQNAADLKRVDRVVERARPRSDGTFTIVSVGRLEKVKDPLTLLAAFRQVATTGDGRLVFIGAGALETELRDQVAAWGLQDRVEIAGLVPREEVFARFATADAFVSVSHGEGLPVAVMEAMAAGLPAVLSDIPPHHEVVQGVSFVPLVRSGDVDGFAAALANLRTMSAEERRKTGLLCRDLVLGAFTIEAMHSGYERVYRELDRPPVRT